jgi:hypothetical protein
VGGDRNSMQEKRGRKANYRVIISLVHILMYGKISPKGFKNRKKE